jgi:hypothetical protein
MPSEFNWPTNCGTLSIEEVRLAAAGGVGGTGSRAILKYFAARAHGRWDCEYRTEMIRLRVCNCWGGLRFSLARESSVPVRS